MGYVDVENFTKVIKRQVVLDDINITLERGQVVGFIGPNGCGKSMLFRAISGLIKPDKGSVSIDGHRLGKDMSFPPSLGLVIENVGLWPDRTAIDNLSILADIKKRIGRESIEATMERVGLSQKNDKVIRKYSLGMKQRLVIAQAIMEKPDLIILDEPTSALDEKGIGLIRRIILEEKERGATVLLSSHNSSDIDLLCDEIFRLYEGSIVDHKVRSMP